MRISQDVRNYARQRGIDADTALRLGMAQKSDEFRDEGARVYLPVTELEQTATSQQPTDAAGGAQP